MRWIGNHTAMHEDETERIRRACTELSIGYARAIDFRDYDTFLTLFTDDAVLDAGDQLDGLDAIRAAIRRRPDELRSRHVISNVFIDILNEREARGISYVTVYRHHGLESLRHGPAPLPGPAAVGHYEDRFVRGDAGWQFKSRRLHLAFRDPERF